MADSYDITVSVTTKEGETHFKYDAKNFTEEKKNALMRFILEQLSSNKTD